VLAVWCSDYTDIPEVIKFKWGQPSQCYAVVNHLGISLDLQCVAGDGTLTVSSYDGPLYLTLLV